LLLKTATFKEHPMTRLLLRWSTVTVIKITFTLLASHLKYSWFYVLITYLKLVLWCGSVTTMALHLCSCCASSTLAVALLRTNLRQVCHTPLPLSPSSIIWYWWKQGGERAHRATHWLRICGLATQLVYGWGLIKEPKTSHLMGLIGSGRLVIFPYYGHSTTNLTLHKAGMYSSRHLPWLEVASRQFF